MDLQDFLKSNAFTQSSSNAFNFTSNNIDLSKINEVPKAAPKAHDLNDFLTGKASSLDPSAEKTINSKKTYVEFPVPDYPPFMATFCNFLLTSLKRVSRTGSKMVSKTQAVF